MAEIAPPPHSRSRMGGRRAPHAESEASELTRAIEDYRRGLVEEAAHRLDSLIAEGVANAEAPEWYVEALVAKGEAERRLGNSDSAIDAFTQAIAVAQSVGRSNDCMYAIALHGASRAPEASGLLEQCVKRDSGPEAKLHLAEIRLDQDEAGEAVALSEAALDEMPYDLLTHEVLGEALIRDQRLEDARDRFGEAADLALNSSRWEDAARLLRRSTQIGVGDLEETVDRAWEFARVGRNELAESVIDAVLQVTPTGPYALASKGQLLVFRDEYPAAEDYFRQAVDEEPDYAEARWGLGEAIRLQGRPEEALPLLEEVINQRPQWAMPHVSIAAAYVDLEEYSLALASVDKGLELESENAFGFAVRGIVQERRGRADSAIGSYERAIELDPRIETAYEPLIDLYAKDRRWDEAVRVANKFLSQVPDDASALKTKGQLLLASGDLPGAIGALKSAWEIDPTVAGEQLVIAYEELGNQREVEAIVAQALAIDPETPWALERQGRSARGTGDQQQSVESLRKVLLSNPDRKSAYEPYVLGLYEIGDRAAARKTLVEFVDRFGDEPWALELLSTQVFHDAETEEELLEADDLFERAQASGSASPSMLSDWGETRRLLGDPARATQLLRESLSADPYNVRSLRRLGYAELDLDDSYGALDAFKRAEELAPKNPDVLTDVAVGYAQIDDFEQALSAAERAVAYDSDHANALGILGNLYGLIGRFDEAIEVLESAVALDPDFAQAWSDLGFAAEITGSVDKAAVAYSRAVELNEYDVASRVGVAEIIRVKDLDAGTEAFKTIIDELAASPPQPGKLAWMGWCHYRLGEFDEAIRLYDLALKKDPRQTFVYFDRGLARLSVGDDRARSDYDQGVSDSYRYQSIRQEGLLAVAFAELSFAIEEQEGLKDNPTVTWALDLLDYVASIGPPSTLS